MTRVATFLENEWLFSGRKIVASCESAVNIAPKLIKICRWMTELKSNGIFVAKLGREILNNNLSFIT